MTITQRSRHPHRRRTGLAVVAALALIGAACGDDDDDSAGGTADETTATTAAGDSAGGAAGGDTAAFCDARVGLEQAFASEPPDTQAITGLIGEMQAAAPADLTANVEAISGVLETAAESGEDPARDPAFAENVGPIDQYALAECGYETVEVTGVDYAFEGVPETVPAGVVGFELVNEGEEPHEIVIFRVNEGVTGTAEELLSAPEEQVMQNLTFAGAAMAGPGQSGVSFAELEPGRYVASCFIPVGGGEEGPPHFMEGMTAEFEVA